MQRSRNGLASSTYAHSGDPYSVTEWLKCPAYWVCTETMRIVSLRKQPNHLMFQNKLMAALACIPVTLYTSLPQCPSIH